MLCFFGTLEDIDFTKYAGIHGHGQAPVVRVALTGRLGKPPRAVPVSDVQTELTRQGANLRGTLISKEIPEHA